MQISKKLKILPLLKMLELKKLDTKNMFQMWVMIKPCLSQQLLKKIKEARLNVSQGGVTVL